MRKKVALLVESSRAYGRGVLTGIAAYARATGTGPSIFTSVTSANLFLNGSSRGKATESLRAWRTCKSFRIW